MVKEAVYQPVAPDAPAGAVLQLQVGGGDLPALVFAADEVEGGYAHVVEIDGLLDSPEPAPDSPPEMSKSIGWMVIPGRWDGTMNQPRFSWRLASGSVTVIVHI